MNPAQRLKELLDELAPLLGQESLPIDETGICTLMVDGSLALNLAATDDMLTLFAPLGEVPAERKPAMLEQMLRANGAGNASFVLGLARNTDTALISARRPWHGLDVQALEQWAGAFVDTAMQWRAALAQSPGNPPDASPATGWLQA